MFRFNAKARLLHFFASEDKVQKRKKESNEEERKKEKVAVDKRQKTIGRRLSLKGSLWGIFLS